VDTYDSFDSAGNGGFDSGSAFDSSGFSHSGSFVDSGLFTDSGQFLHTGDAGDTGANLFLDYLTNDCTSSATASVLTVPGTYHWPAAGYTNMTELSDPNTCTAFGSFPGSASKGIDGLLRVELQAGETLDVRYQLVGGDAIVYLLTDCLSVSSCVEGSDNDFSLGGWETLVYTNSSSAAAVYTLVLDEYDFGVTPSTFRLEFDIY